MTETMTATACVVVPIGKVYLLILIAVRCGLPDRSEQQFKLKFQIFYAHFYYKFASTFLNGESNLNVRAPSNIVFQLTAQFEPCAQFQSEFRCIN